MKAMRQSSTVVPYVVSRTQLGQITPESPTTFQAGIKNMPDYDPDAEITGLTLTMLRLAGRNTRAVRNDILYRKLLREKFAWEMDDIDEYLVAEGFDPISKRYKLVS